MKVWIARDGEQNGNNDFELYFYFTKPELSPDGTCYDASNYFDLPTKSYPKIKNGECYEAEIVLGSKVN